MGRFTRVSSSSVSDQPGDRNTATGRNVTQLLPGNKTCMCDRVRNHLYYEFLFKLMCCIYFSSHLVVWCNCIDRAPSRAPYVPQQRKTLRSWRLVHMSNAAINVSIFTAFKLLLQLSVRYILTVSMTTM